MSRIPLNTLKAFEVAASLQNLRAAAEVLHLTHSAVSQQIRVLEDQLGFSLFERVGRRVVLNAAGEALLCSVRVALSALDKGVQTAAAAACGAEQRLRLSVLPSFAQRWLLPRMSRWHARHPEIAIEIDVSQQAVDLQREGFHAALRHGRGPWQGLVSEPLFDAPMPLFPFACPADARRLAGVSAHEYLREPLLGDKEVWQRWFAQAGVHAQVNPVAQFNDMGLMLQAVEQGLGLTLARELLAADAIRDGRLIKLSSVSVEYELGQTYHLVYPPALRDWRPLVALRVWINDELERSQHLLRE